MRQAHLILPMKFKGHFFFQRDSIGFMFTNKNLKIRVAKGNIFVSLATKLIYLHKVSQQKFKINLKKISPHQQKYFSSI